MKNAKRILIALLIAAIMVPTIALGAPISLYANCTCGAYYQESFSEGKCEDTGNDHTYTTYYYNIGVSCVKT